MLSLVELQHGMRDAILATPSQALLAEVVSDRLDARRRIEIYRDHYRVSLKQGLAELFPATRALLGERCFDAIAGLHLTTHPPREPRLAEYGEDFPRYLALHDAMAEFAFVPEVARLEWMLARVAAAPQVAARALADHDRALCRFGDRFRLRLTPAARLFASDWQVHAIRHRALIGEDAERIAPLVYEPRPVRLLLHRGSDDDVRELLLDEAAYAALRHLRAGRSVAEAGEAALSVQPGYPVPALLVYLFEAGLVADLGPVPAPRSGAPTGVPS